MNQWLKWHSGAGLRARRLIKAADQAYAHQDYASALPLYRESLDLIRPLELWDTVMWLRLRLGMLCLEMMNDATARTHYEQCVSLARSHRSHNYLGAGLLGLAHIAGRHGEYALAKRLCAECLPLWKGSQNVLSLAGVYGILGSIADTYEEAHEYKTKMLTLCRQSGDTSATLAALCSLGYLSAPDQDNASAKSCLEECLELCLVSGNQKTRSYALNNQGDIERFAGNLEKTEELYQESLQLKREAGDEWGIAYTLEGCAALAAAQGQGEKAARLFGAATAIRERLGTPLEPFKLAQHQAEVNSARSLFPAPEFERAWSEGKALAWADAVKEAASDSPPARKQTFSRS